MKSIAKRAQGWGDAMERREHRDGARRTFQRSANTRPRVATRATASAPARADGLVIAAYLSVTDEGRLVQLKLPGIAPEAPETRGDVEGFSDASRRRLVAYLHRIRRDAPLPTMMSLTFPEEFVVTPQEAKQCRRAFAKRVRKKYALWCSLWRLEAHPEMSTRLGRVHPHFHMLTWGAWYDLQWVSDVWTDIVWKVLRIDYGVCDAEGKLVKVKHLLAGTNCEKVRKWEGVIYCAKTYVAKEEEYPIGKAGRVWGWDWRDNLPLAEERTIPLTHGQAFEVRLQVQAWMREERIVSEYLLCTFFQDDPCAFVERLLTRHHASTGGKS